MGPHPLALSRVTIGVKGARFDVLITESPKFGFRLLVAAGALAGEETWIVPAVVFTLF